MPRFTPKPFVEHHSSGAFFKFSKTDPGGRMFMNAGLFEDELERNPDVEWFDNPSLKSELPKSVSDVDLDSALADELADLKSQLALTTSLNTALTTANNSLQFTVDTLSKELADLKVDLADTEADLEDANKSLDALKNAKPISASVPKAPGKN